MAGTGQEIVSPAFLQRFKLDLAIAMNPIYQPRTPTWFKVPGAYNWISGT
jgi:hypothetical protein